MQVLTRPRRVPRSRLLLLALLFAWIPYSPARAAISKEYQVKAIFLFNFAQFVQWPPATFTRADEPFRIGILGEDPFSTFLDETVRGEKINGHPLVVQRYRGVEDAKGCQILFVSRSESKKMESILASLRGKNILTVGDADGFIKNGGVIRFFKKNNKIHFKVSLEAAKSGKLDISSKMLRLAEIAKPGKD